MQSANEKQIDKLGLVLQNTVAFHALKTENMVILCSVKNKEAIGIILDSEFISFEESVRIAESFNNKGFTFRIIPNNTRFLIGSNNSNEIIIVK